MNCLNYIDKLKREAHNLNNKYKNTYYKTSSFCFNSNKEMISYRDNILNTKYIVQERISINYKNKWKYEKLLNLMYNNLIYYEILYSKLV